MIHIVRYLEKKEIPTITYTSLYKDRINKLKEFYENLEQKQEESEDKYENEATISKYILTEEDEPEKLEKPKKKELNYICIFDDLSEELKDRTIAYFLKRNRHFHCLCILLSQYWFDLAKMHKIKLTTC
jgi:hypothetical protein